jgi:hypothetical protein
VVPALDVLQTGLPARGGASLPAEVALEVQRRRLAMLDRAQGRVLDLADPERADVLASAAAARGAGEVWDDGRRYDTIVCAARLVHEPDLARAVGGLDQLLADHGELLAVEPVLRPGWWGVLSASAGSALPALAGLHVARDVVAALRAAGLTVADVERFQVRTRVWPLRRLVDLRAVRIPRSDREP